jgi:hypothetical protein
MSFTIGKTVFGNDTFADIGGAVSDLFGGFGGLTRASGYEDEASGFFEASRLAKQNIGLEDVATKIQQTQAEREALKVIGGQISDVAGSGFAESGTALDLLRSSSSQAALQHQLIGEQGSIQENAYQEQADAYQAEGEQAQAAASASSSSSFGSFLGSALKGIAAIGTLFVAP